MLLTPPVEIAPNLEAGARIGKGWVTIRYADRPRDEGRTRYVFTILDDDLEYVDDTMQSGCCGDRNLYAGFCSLLSFLRAEADAYRYFMYKPGAADDPGYWILSEKIGEWCYQNSEELETLDLELEEHPECIKE